MAKNRKSNSGDERRRKPAKKSAKKPRLPKGDYVKVKPIKRTPEEQEEAEFFALLAHHWDIVADKQKAATCAFDQGVAVCEEFDGKLPKDANFVEMYRRSAIRGAMEVGVINDVEYECWRFETQDPRVIWFRRGFLSARGKLEHSR